MSKPVWTKMIQFDPQDLLLSEINLLKYINPWMIYRLLPKNVQRMVDVLVTKGEYTLDWIIVKKVNKHEDWIIDASGISIK